jgi:hypothetical protein
MGLSSAHAERLREHATDTYFTSDLVGASQSTNIAGAGNNERMLSGLAVHV